MTTPKRGGSPMRAGNNARVQYQTALRRQCPKCGRKQALINPATLPDNLSAACRWCDYVKVIDDGWTAENGWPDPST